MSSTSTWNVRAQSVDLTQLPVMMGIVNTTPDSFSDGGEFLDPRRAVARSRREKEG
ncbi:MAG: dihydropteroate synthase [Planctomycetaceae bacterium]